MKCEAHGMTRNACMACLRDELTETRNSLKNVLADFGHYRKDETRRIQSQTMFTSTGPSPELSLNRIAFALEGILTRLNNEGAGL